MRKCEHWDSGWCYKKDTKYRDGCVGSDKCDYMANPSCFGRKLGNEACFHSCPVHSQCYDVTENKPINK